MKIQTVFSGQRGVITAIFVTSIFVNLLILTAPLYMIQLFQRVMSSGSIATLVALTTGAAIALLFYFFFDALRQRLVARLGTRLEARLSPMVLRAMIDKRLPDGMQGSEPLRDVQEVRSFVTSPIFVAMLDAPWALFFTVLVFMFHPLLGVIAVLGIGTLAAIGVFSEIMTRESEKQAQTSAKDANRAVDEMMTHAELIRAHGKSEAMLERWKMRAFSAIMFSTRATDRMAIMSSAAKGVRQFLQIGMMCAGVILVVRAEISPGLMIASSILLGRAAAPVEQSISGWRSLINARAAKERLNAMLAAVKHVDEHRMELPEPSGRIDVQNATVMLPGRSEPLLYDISLGLRPGDSLGLIGPSGAGKTTLARAMIGLIPLARGAVRIDDADVRDWPSDQLGQYVGFLSQQVDLFRGTIAENIALMDSEARASDIVAAAKEAEVHDLILGLPGGYNADVGPRGGFLSAGQRQRIGLARAFMGRPKIIVLDEPNANLDPAGEAALARAIQNATARGAVVIAVTHRMSLLRQVTHAALIRDGRLARFGTAKEVLEASVEPVLEAGKPTKRITVVPNEGTDERKGAQA
jgi:PrtD family type I secretion system ABC transporter